MRRVSASLAALLIALGTWAAAQGITKSDEYRVATMLHDAYDAVRHNYYDPTFHGLDLDARYREYDDKLKTAGSLNAGLIMVAGFLEGLKDSHTYFAPPARAYRLDYGYRLALIGDQTFVTRVRPATDAVGKVRVGDRLVALNGQALTRGNFESAEYTLNLLQPQPTTRLTLQSPAGDTREVVVETKIVPGRQFFDLTGPGADLDRSDELRQREASDRVNRMRIAELGDVMIWKMPTFLVENSELDKVCAIAARHHTLILDLRDNPGGLIEAMRRLVSNLIDHDVTVADEVTRKGRSRILARTRGHTGFSGTLIVLIDGGSASSAELLARVVQLEKRGVVLGDRSAGAVMETQIFPYAAGGNIKVFYQFAVTYANLLMTDGHSLEGTGVTPDELALPTAADLAAGRDPVLSRAAALGGLVLTPVAAGLLFPVEWVPFQS
jgi:carboxyl-terminal processing protease